jgi:hypothetical protein
MKHKQVSERLSQQELEEIRNYAERFQFEELDKHLHKFIVHIYPERPGQMVQKTIKRAAEINEKRHLPYAALFVLRLYRKQKELYHQGYSLKCQYKYKERYYLAEEFARIAKLREPEVEYVTTFDCYNWVQKYKKQFLDYPLIIQELTKIDQLQEEFDLQWHQAAGKITSAQFRDLKNIKKFAMQTPVTRFGRQPVPVPEQINRILTELREQHRTDHLPYLLEYGLNLFLKNLTLSRLARVLPVNENLILSELIRLTNIPKYETAHEAGWLNSQFYGPFQDTNVATGYSSYQIYIWYLENWSSVLDMPNIERLRDIQKKIEKTGMHGVGGGKVCHYHCH